MNKPIAVITSDVHYSVQTLDKADYAMRTAITKANSLQVPLIVAGDLHDSKAHLRGEYVNAIIETFKQCEVPPIVLIGNHDRLNEKAPAHSLNFLAPYAMVVDEPKYIHPLGYFIPYQHDKKDFIAELKNVPEGSIIICHQGITGSASGDYIQDHSAVKPVALPHFRVISGHYHARQTIILPYGGSWDYVGNPYTMTFGEAEDPDKGYQVLYNDGSLESVRLDLPAHRKMDLNYVSELRTFYGEAPKLRSGDILKVTVKGPSDELSKVTKQYVQELVNFSNIRLEFEPQAIEGTVQEEPTSQSETLDIIIETANIEEPRKARLKALWRTLE
jgi:DNA repair exonuclease SbcCD nuclease subunit